MTPPFHSIKIIHLDGSTQLYWDDSPYHSDKLFPILEQAILSEKRIHLFVLKNDKTELDMFFLQPDFTKLRKFILSYPKVKLYKSFYLFVNGHFI